MYFYHNKKFKVVNCSENSEISNDTIFIYKQNGNILTCDYSGGKVKIGNLIGLVDHKGSIEIRYQQINNNNEFMTGICYSKPELLSNGKIRLYETWRWTSGDRSYGTSVIEEV